MKTFKQFVTEDREFEVGHAHDKTTKTKYSTVHAKNAKHAIQLAKASSPKNHSVVQVFDTERGTFHHPDTGRKMKNQYEE